MLLAIDVDYRDETAVVAGVLFERWNDATPVKVVKTLVQEVEAYVPGKFYQRELPCILSLLREHDLLVDCIIVDGYVYLDEQEKPGLGKYLYDSLDGDIPIIGVAKNPFFSSCEKFEILRGESQKALYVTSVGLELEKAKEYIVSMSGKYRFPTLLKQADKECRE